MRPLSRRLARSLVAVTFQVVVTFHRVTFQAQVTFHPVQCAMLGGHVTQLGCELGGLGRLENRV